MQSRRLLKALQVGHLHRSALCFQVHNHVVNESWIAKSGFHAARWWSNVSEGTSVKDKDSTPGVPNGTEMSGDNIKKEPKVAETVASSVQGSEKSSKKATDVVKSEAGESKLQNLLKETQALVKEKDKMVVQAKQEVLTYLAEVENVRGRTRRDAESIKKHAVEVFATDLLDMADNLGRAAATVPENIRDDALGADSSGNAKLLKSLREGVDMTQKQLMKIFNKFGVQKYDPIGQKYDPNQHLAITEVEDASKEPQTIVNVVKSGYFLNDKLLRPAEVGIVKKRAESPQ